MSRALQRKSPVQARQRRPWVRRMVRRASTTPAALEAILAAMPTLPRRTVEQAIEAMIERLDALDGDPDLELDEEPEDDTDAEPSDFYLLRPIYGVDQTKGALNLVEAHQAHSGDERSSCGPPAGFGV